MKKAITFKKNLFTNIEIFVCGVFFGGVSFVSADTYIKMNLEENLKNEHFRYMTDIMFLNDNYKNIEYMRGNAMKLITILLYFYIPFLMFVLYKYSKETSGYYSMLMVRVNSRKEFINTIRKKPFILSVSYVCGFLGYILAAECFNRGVVFTDKAFLNCIIWGVSRIVVLVALAEIFFLMYIKYSAGVSFFAGMLLFFMLIAADLNTDKINIMLYHVGGYYIDCIVISFVILVLVRVMQRNISNSKYIR